MGPIRSKIGGKRTKIGPFWGVVFHENTSCKSKPRSKGTDLFWAPTILQLNRAYGEYCYLLNFSSLFSFALLRYSPFSQSCLVQSQIYACECDTPALIAFQLCSKIDCLIFSYFNIFFVGGRYFGHSIKLFLYLCPDKIFVMRFENVF